MQTTRIYIVEDEALIAMEISDRLTQLGYDICGRAARGEQALEEIPRTHPDIVLMDIRLAGELTGTETAARLRKRLDVPVVFLTAFSDDSLLKEAIDTEPFGYLVKPFEERELHATLQAALYRHRLQHQRMHDRKLENQLQIAGSIAHEFNNLLQVITGHLTLSRMALQEDHRGIARNLDEAMRAAQTAADITSRLFVYTGKSHIGLKLTNLNEIVQTYSAALPLPREATSRLQLHLGDGIPSIMANDQQIRQLLDQLVTNSVEAIGATPGTIQLSTGTMECDEEQLSHSYLEGTTCPGTFAYLEVEDDGCGMDDAALQRAFDLFFSTKFLGRGLGLPSVRGIVQSHGGGLLATSNPGQGTKVRILFPIPETPPAATSLPRPQ
ncbi:MAG: response regulator [Nitrospirota bacterium]|nr:response regulator [Nitrospirota bacterium]MDP2382037.1 response regulator [Nitrospirota bacterium]MDP3595824.1 response regulator [Nitrospirota bacterium]